MIALASDTFSRTHIALTAVTTGVIVLGFAIWRLRGHRAWIAQIVTAVLVTAAVFLWRSSVNMPQLNRDGLAGYSANDWLAPVITFVVLSVYADLFRPHRAAVARPPRPPGEGSPTIQRARRSPRSSSTSSPSDATGGTNP